jgi:5'-nucleotidase/UDP-sugar diphosphatase
MRRLVLALCLFALPLSAAEVTLLHFSDYHSHALPFYTDAGERGGIARAIGYLEAEKRRGALVFSGGDTINKGAPAWSDKYTCAEWPWFNGIVDAMAFGNHEPDYGREAFERCRAAVRYPILSANVAGFEPYRVFERDGVRIGVFALAGRDFAQLVKAPGFSFSDPFAAARETVKLLRWKERVNVVVMIGHQHTEDDYALASKVPGIDVIFGSHSHLERALTRIAGTSTWFISPGQYLTLISRVVLTVRDGNVAEVRGELVPVDARMRPKRAVARRVAKMQRALERDPEFRELFVPVARLDAPMSTAALAAKTLAVMRGVTKSDVALSTTSSFRSPLAAGAVTGEALRAALPYDNEIVVCTMDAVHLYRVLDWNRQHTGTDSEAYLDAPDRSEIDFSRKYRVATTDYLANVAYRDVFICEKEKSGLRVREELQKALAGRD